MDKNYILVYEISNEPIVHQLPEFLVLLLFLFVIVGVVLSIISECYTWKDAPAYDPDRKEKLTFGKLHFGITLLIFIGLLPFSDYVLTNKVLTNKEYRNGKFKTVEGKIENFHPMPKEGHDHESFTVNNIYFEYGDYYKAFHGFSNAASHGGPLTHNGQQVRLGYITHSYQGKTEIFYDHVIVKIEILK